jgi:hypothetical protein
MAWTDSRIFAAFITDVLNNTTAMDLNTDANIKVALHGTGVTPDRTVASASTAYNTGTWASDHITDTGSSAPAGWPTVGLDLGSVTSTFATGTYTFDAADRASANAVTTITAAYGCLVYDDTITTPVADQGICFNYFGGSQSVTLGTFTIVWNGSGIFTITV